ncbi:inovirus-type Gp2 protein [Pseudomonas sp. PS01303]
MSRRVSCGKPEGQTAFFHRTSYLCKPSTKALGDANHGFGCSQS